MTPKYPEELRIWLIENISTHTYCELLELIADNFKISIPYKTFTAYVHYLCKKHSLSTPISQRRFSQDELDFIRSLHFTHSDKQIVKLFTARFRKPLALDTISYLRKTKFKERKLNKIREDNTTYPVCRAMGEEKYNGKDYYVKTSCGWVSKRRVEYEQFFSEKLSPTDIIICLDGNPANCSKDNLCKVTRAQSDKLAGSKLTGKGKLTEAALEIIKTEEVLSTIATAR